MTRDRFQCEATDQGEQSLVPGVRPLSRRDRLQALVDAPLQPKCGQRACNVGLFDEDACNQLDLFTQGET